MIWTPERIEELLALWRQGLTSYQMADHFGVSRGSIMGKLHRARIAMGEKPKRQSDLTRTERRRRAKMLTTLASRAESVSAYVSPRPSAPDEGQLASIVDVTGCRWPVRDDPAFVGGVAFCNHTQHEGSSYCQHHMQESIAAYSRAVINRALKSALVRRHDWRTNGVLGVQKDDGFVIVATQDAMLAAKREAA